MTRVLAVAGNTFREAARDKVLHVLVGIAAAVILGSKALGWISVGQDIKIVKDLSLATLSVFGALIAILVGASLLYKEMDKRTVYTILAQPIHRWEFVLGKYLGLAALLGVVTAVLAGTAAGYVLALGGDIDATFLLAALLTYFKLLLVTAVALLCSALSSPILGSVIVFCVYVFGHATGVFLDLPPQFDGTAAKRILEAAYYVVPNLSNFDLRAEAANGVPVRAGYVLWAMIYGAGHTAVFLILAALAFEGKDV